MAAVDTALLVAVRELDQAVAAFGPHSDHTPVAAASVRLCDALLRANRQPHDAGYCPSDVAELLDLGRNFP